MLPRFFLPYTFGMTTPADDITNKTLERLVEYAHNEIPGFDIKYKDDSTFMKVLGFLSKPFNPRFMSDFTTTVGTTMYVPKNDFLYCQNDYIEVVAHELVHMRESQKNGSVLYFLRYFFPQILALLSLFAIGGIWSPWFLFALVFVACLAPLPSPGRREIEMNGYVMSLCIRYWTTMQLLEPDFAGVAREFTGPAYYFMWPWREEIIRELKMRAMDIRTNKVLGDSMFSEIHQIVMKR